MLYDKEKRYKLVKDGQEVFFKSEKYAIKILSHNKNFKDYNLDSEECLICNLSKDKLCNAYDCLYLVNVAVDAKIIELRVEGTYGEVFVVIHEYMSGKSYKILSVYEYSYYYGKIISPYEEDVPNDFILSILDNLNTNNACVIASIIEDINLDIANEKQLLEHEKMCNMSNGQFLYDYNVENNIVHLNEEGIKKRCKYLTRYIISESLDIEFVWMMTLFAMQDRVKYSNDKDELLYLTGKLYCYLRSQLCYPYTYYKMVREGKFDNLRQVKDTYV